MKKIILALSILFCLCGCGKVKGYASAQDKLMNMLSYRAEIDISYISSDGDSTYTAIQTADNQGRYKLEVTSPENLNGSSILFDGKMIWQYNPNIEQKISINAEDKPERSELNLFSFMENYVKSTDTTVTTAKAEETQCTVLEANIEGAGKYIASEKLWISNEDMLPQKLVIYDSEGKERIRVDFNSFEYNAELTEDEFVPQKQ